MGCGSPTLIDIRLPNLLGASIEESFYSPKRRNECNERPRAPQRVHTHERSLMGRSTRDRACFFTLGARDTRLKTRVASRCHHPTRWSSNVSWKGRWDRKRTKGRREQKRERRSHKSWGISWSADDGSGFGSSIRAPALDPRRPRVSGRRGFGLLNGFVD
jgi:hypothetical protein